jgi:hypothetical protein
MRHGPSFNYYSALARSLGRQSQEPVGKQAAVVYFATFLDSSRPLNKQLQAAWHRWKTAPDAMSWCRRRTPAAIGLIAA